MNMFENIVKSLKEAELESDKEFNLDINIKDWYISTFPTDDMGKDLKEDITFEGLFDIINSQEDIYDFLGAGDSVIRERVFLELSILLGQTYDYVYNLWSGNR